MASNPLSDSPARDLRGANENQNAFRVSAVPVIPERNGTRRQNSPDELPRSYGLETLWLLARDPHSLFAYWDIDWKAAFGEDNPRPRSVQLRVLAEDDSEHAQMEVEPMAGQCSVRVERADSAYRAEIGYVDPAGDWHVVSRSESVSVPPETEGQIDPAHFATLPLHLSFQRMLDATRFAAEVNDSLTGRLSQLRQRAITAEQRDILRAIDEAAALQPLPATEDSTAPNLWEHHQLERIFGFGNSSLNGGFGGSSRG